MTADQGQPAPERTMPHPWDLNADQCLGLACVWCKAPLEEGIPAGVAVSEHRHRTVTRVVEFEVNSCRPCSRAPI